MSQRPFSLSPDLKRLREEGFFVQIRDGMLIMRDVPYVDSQLRVQRGTLISSLEMAADVTRRPEDHKVYFDGDFPFNSNGTPINYVVNQSANFDLGNGLYARHLFSSKPEGGYVDYHHKMTAYANLLAGPAQNLEPGTTPRTFRQLEEEEDSVFNYLETASGRVGIGALNIRFAAEKIGILGLGGSGSYVLDLVAKTPVREIRIIDGDEFLQHNAFRAPGAPSIDELREAPSKVNYLKGIYSRMHRGIVAHSVPIGPTNLDLLDGLTFVFICIDDGPTKRLVVDKLDTLRVAFIDVGMGIELIDGALSGILRVTSSTVAKREHVHRGLIPFEDGGKNDLYASNIQIAELNALNATMAVIKWKKLQGFYHDLEGEHHSSYTITGNLILNSETG